MYGQEFSPPRKGRQDIAGNHSMNIIIIQLLSCSLAFSS